MAHPNPNPNPSPNPNASPISPLQSLGEHVMGVRDLQSATGRVQSAEGQAPRRKPHPATGSKVGEVL